MRLRSNNICAMVMAVACGFVLIELGRYGWPKVNFIAGLLFIFFAIALIVLSYVSASRYWIAWLMIILIPTAWCFLYITTLFFLIGKVMIEFRIENASWLIFLAFYIVSSCSIAINSNSRNFRKIAYLVMMLAIIPFSLIAYWSI